MRPRAHTMVYQGMPRLVIIKRSEEPLHGVHYTSPAVRIGQDAIEATCGIRPLLIRAGGTLPVLGALSAKGIPTILTGFDLPKGNIHAPDERLLLDYVPLGIATARKLFLRLSALPVVR